MRGRSYRYYSGTPLYPFGYGLSYSPCRVAALRWDGAEAEVLVRNEGTRDTEEVLQLYLKDELSPFAPPHPALCGFLRIRLRAGEEKRFSLPIAKDAFTVVTDEGLRIPGSGSFRLYAGLGGPDPRTEELTGQHALSILLSKP